MGMDPVLRKGLAGFREAAAKHRRGWVLDAHGKPQLMCVECTAPWPCTVVRSAVVAADGLIRFLSRPRFEENGPRIPPWLNQ